MPLSTIQTLFISEQHREGFGKRKMEARNGCPFLTINLSKILVLSPFSKTILLSYGQARVKAILAIRSTWARASTKVLMQENRGNGWGWKNRGIYTGS